MNISMREGLKNGCSTRCKCNNKYPLVANNVENNYYNDMNNENNATARTPEAASMVDSDTSLNAVDEDEQFQFRLLAEGNDHCVVTLVNTGFVLRIKKVDSGALPISEEKHALLDGISQSSSTLSEENNSSIKHSNKILLGNETLNVINDTKLRECGSLSSLRQTCDHGEIIPGPENCITCKRKACVCQPGEFFHPVTASNSPYDPYSSSSRRSCSNTNCSHNGHTTCISSVNGATCSCTCRNNLSCININRCSTIDGCNYSRSIIDGGKNSCSTTTNNCSYTPGDKSITTISSNSGASSSNSTEVCTRSAMIQQCSRDLAFLNHIALSLFGPQLVKPGRLVCLTPKQLQVIKQQMQFSRDERRLHKTINPYGIAVMCPDASAQFQGLWSEIITAPPLAGRAAKKSTQTLHHRKQLQVFPCGMLPNITASEYDASLPKMGCLLQEKKEKVPAKQCQETFVASCHFTHEFQKFKDHLKFMMDDTIDERMEPTAVPTENTLNFADFDKYSAAAEALLLDEPPVCSEDTKTVVPQYLHGDSQPAIIPRSNRFNPSAHSICSKEASTIHLNEHTLISETQLGKDAMFIKARKGEEKFKLCQLLFQLCLSKKSFSKCSFKQHLSSLDIFQQKADSSIDLQLDSCLKMLQSLYEAASASDSPVDSKNVTVNSNDTRGLPNVHESAGMNLQFQSLPTQSISSTAVANPYYSPAKPACLPAKHLYIPSTVCVELKPKQGFLECTELDNMQLCRFCLKQFIKCDGGSQKKRSSYCPLELFSGDEGRMAAAVRELFAAPQNNLRIFRDGVVVGNYEEYMHLCDVIPKVLLHCPVSDHEQAVLTDSFSATATADAGFDSQHNVLAGVDRLPTIPLKSSMQQYNVADVSLTNIQRKLSNTTEELNNGLLSQSSSYRVKAKLLDMKEVQRFSSGAMVAKPIKKTHTEITGELALASNLLTSTSYSNSSNSSSNSSTISSTSDSGHNSDCDSEGECSSETVTCCRCCSPCRSSCSSDSNICYSSRPDSSTAVAATSLRSKLSSDSLFSSASEEVESGASFSADELTSTEDSQETAADSQADVAHEHPGRKCLLINGETLSKGNFHIENAFSDLSKAGSPCTVISSEQSLPSSCNVTGCCGKLCSPSHVHSPNTNSPESQRNLINNSSEMSSAYNSREGSSNLTGLDTNCYRSSDTDDRSSSYDPSTCDVACGGSNSSDPLPPGCVLGKVLSSQRSHLPVVEAARAYQRLLGYVGEARAKELINAVDDGHGGDVCKALEQGGCVTVLQCLRDWGKEVAVRAKENLMVELAVNEVETGRKNDGGKCLQEWKPEGDQGQKNLIESCVDRETTNNGINNNFNAKEGSTWGAKNILNRGKNNCSCIDERGDVELKRTSVCCAADCVVCPSSECDRCEPLSAPLPCNNSTHSGASHDQLLNAAKEASNDPTGVCISKQVNPSTTSVDLVECCDASIFNCSCRIVEEERGSLVKPLSNQRLTQGVMKLTEESQRIAINNIEDRLDDVPCVSIKDDNHLYHSSGNECHTHASQALPSAAGDDQRRCDSCCAPGANSSTTTSTRCPSNNSTDSNHSVSSIATSTSCHRSNNSHDSIHSLVEAEPPFLSEDAAVPSLVSGLQEFLRGLTFKDCSLMLLLSGPHHSAEVSSAERSDEKSKAAAAGLAGAGIHGSHDATSVTDAAAVRPNCWPRAHARNYFPSTPNDLNSTNDLTFTTDVNNDITLANKTTDTTLAVSTSTNSNINSTTSSSMTSISTSCSMTSTSTTSSSNSITCSSSSNSITCSSSINSITCSSSITSISTSSSITSISTSSSITSTSTTSSSEDTSPFWVCSPSGGWYLCQVTVIDLVSKDPSKVSHHQRAVQKLTQLVQHKRQAGEWLPPCCRVP